MFVFVVWFRAVSQEIGWEERVRNDLFCIGWDVKRKLKLLFIVVSRLESVDWRVDYVLSSSLVKVHVLFLLPRIGFNR